MGKMVHLLTHTCARARAPFCPQRCDQEQTPADAGAVDLSTRRHLGGPEGPRRLNQRGRRVPRAGGRGSRVLGQGAGPRPVWQERGGNRARSMTQEFREQNALVVDGRLLCRHFLWGRCIKAGGARACSCRGGGAVSGRNRGCSEGSSLGCRAPAASWSTSRATTTSSKNCASSTCRASAPRAAPAPTCTISFHPRCHGDWPRLRAVLLPSLPPTVLSL